MVKIGRRGATQIKPPSFFILSETLPVDKPPRLYYNELWTNRGSVRAVFAAFEGENADASRFFDG